MEDNGFRKICPVNTPTIKKLRICTKNMSKALNKMHIKTGVSKSLIIMETRKNTNFGISPNL